MITIRESIYIPEPAGWHFEMDGKSTDEKPVGIYRGRSICNGSQFVEMDTGNLYYYDGAAGEWKKFGGDSDGN